VVTGGRLIGGNSAGVAMQAEQRRGIGGRGGLTSGSRPSVAEARVW
jgi:hypothetical protein